MWWWSQTKWMLHLSVAQDCRKHSPLEKTKAILYTDVSPSVQNHVWTVACVSVVKCVRIIDVIVWKCQNYHVIIIINGIVQLVCENVRKWSHRYLKDNFFVYPEEIKTSSRNGNTIRNVTVIYHETAKSYISSTKKSIAFIGLYDILGACPPNFRTYACSLSPQEDHKMTLRRPQMRGCTLWGL